MVETSPSFMTFCLFNGPLIVIILSLSARSWHGETSELVFLETVQIEHKADFSSGVIKPKVNGKIHVDTNGCTLVSDGTE